MANAMSTPAHIVPEWYFLPFYAILRSIPDKVRRYCCNACIYFNFISIAFY